MEKLIQILIEKNLLTKQQVEELEKKAKKEYKTLEELITERNLVSEENLTKAKSEQFNIPLIDLVGQTIRKDILELIPRELSESYKMVAFDKIGNEIKVALVDPSNLKAQEAMEYIARDKKLKVKYFITSPSGFKYVVKQYTGLPVELEEALAMGEAELGAPIEEELVGEKGFEEVVRAAPVAKLVSNILRFGVDNRASDIHIEPLPNLTRVRYRIDGVLRTNLTLPKYLHSAMITRIKVLANLKIEETRIPQDGRIRIRIGEKEMDLRISTFPLLGTEKVAIRLLDPAQKFLSLEDLGFVGRGLEVIKENIRKTRGILLVTGPTGCGKTTTLYSILNILNREGVNIVTLEDPIEYYIEGVNQSQVNPLIGYDFASGLRAIVRQDPNVIMVGEIRDNETAALAIHAGLTGHVVLSTLHTNDAFGAIPRMMDMGAEPFLIASSLNAVIAQRLVRRICKYCKEEARIDKEVESRVRKELEGVKIDLKKYEDEQGRLKFYRGVGCPRCNKEGLSGRIAIFEALNITEEMRKIIVSGCKIDEVKKEFENQGMIPMKLEGYLKALEGITTIEQVEAAVRE